MSPQFHQAGAESLTVAWVTGLQAIQPLRDLQPRPMVTQG